MWYEVRRDMEYVIVWDTDQSDFWNGFWHADDGMIREYGQKIEFLMIESYKKWQHQK